MIDVKGFLALMRRATHSGYQELLMTNRMFIQCYNIDIDSDVGMHYILPIPHTEQYEDPFYDEVLILRPNKVMDAYRNGKRELDERRRAIKAKTKDVKEELYFQIKKNKAELKFLFYLQDELVSTSVYRTPYPVDMTSANVENCVKAYDGILHNIKPGGVCLVFNGKRMGLQERVTECPQIYTYTVKYHGHKIRVPLARSMFLGIKEVDQFFFSIQESNLDDIYILAIQISKNGLSETFFGYLLNY